MSTCCSYDLVEWGKPFERRERALPEVPAKSVLVKITAAGLCHSDLHIKKGFMDLGAKGKLTFTQRGATLPLTLGHEIAGVIEAVGCDVKSVKIGQQVVVFPWIGCGNCLACAEDRESDCTSMCIIGIHRDGGFASHVVVEDEKFVIDIDGFDAATDKLTLVIVNGTSRILARVCASNVFPQPVGPTKSIFDFDSSTFLLVLLS